MTWTNEFGITLSVDRQGHEHRGKGPGGGQFVSRGESDSRPPSGKMTTEEYREWLDKGWSYGENGWEPPPRPRTPVSEVTDKQHTQAAETLSQGAKDTIKRSHDWETSKPWNASKAEVQNGEREGFVHRTKIHGTEVAEYEGDGVIALTDPFFDIKYEESRRHIIYHELGHQLADTMTADQTAFELTDAEVFPKEHWMGSANTPEEFMADAYATLHTDPNWLKNKHPRSIDIIVKRAKALGMPVPNLDDTNDMTSNVELALWANKVQRLCLLEANGDIEAGLAAAEHIVSTETPESFALSIKGKTKKDVGGKVGERSPLYRYKNLGGDSGVKSYQFTYKDDPGIIVNFNDGSTYTYTESSVGERNLYRMIVLAGSGQGLNSFINREVYHNYSDKDTPLSLALSLWTEDTYPRNTSKQFIDKHLIAEAARNAEKLDDLRESLPDSEKWKLEKAISNLQAGGTIHHPKENPGLGVNIECEIVDPRWAEYHSQCCKRNEWQERHDTRTTHLEYLDDTVKKLRSSGISLKTSKALQELHDRTSTSITEFRESLTSLLKEHTTHTEEIDSFLKRANAQESELRALTRLKHLSLNKVQNLIEAYIAQVKKARREGAEPVEQERLEDRFNDLMRVLNETYSEITRSYEDTVEGIYQRIEKESAEDIEVPAPEEPKPVQLSTDAQGHEHRGKGPGGGQFVRKGEASDKPLEPTKAKKGASKIAGHALLSRINDGSGTEPKQIIESESTKMDRDVKLHDMKEAEPSNGIRLLTNGRTLITWDNRSDTALTTASNATADLAAIKIPNALTHYTKHIHFSPERMRVKSGWLNTLLEDLGIVGKSYIQGTGGEGSVVIHGTPKGISTNFLILHEMAHNLARAEWNGKFRPDTESQYGKAQEVEDSVSNYGETDPGEDFAEAVAMYVTSKDTFSQQFPKKAAAIADLFKRHNKRKDTTKIFSIGEPSAETTNTPDNTRIYFFDDTGNPVDQEVATLVKIIRGNRRIYVRLEAEPAESSAPQTPDEDAFFGMIDGEWRGPKPPSWGKWAPAEPGPRGGKRWRQVGGGKTPRGGTSNEPARRKPQTSEQSGDRAGDGGTARHGSDMGRETARSNDGATGRVRTGKGRSTGVEALSPEQRESINRINKGIDRYANHFRKSGQHDIAEWFDMLKEHINMTGTEEALKLLGHTSTDPSKPIEKVRYLGTGYFEEGSDDTEFLKKYLDSCGIIMQTDATKMTKAPGTRTIVSAPIAGIKEKVGPGDVVARETNVQDKLQESKSLPGLESSEDIHKVIGRQVTQFTPDVIAKLDEVYGKKKWIVKSYGDESYAGFGVFFPQRLEEIRKSSKRALMDSSHRLARYGYTLSRDENRVITGITRTSTGQTYRFNTPEFESIPNKKVKQIGYVAAASAPQERGALLPHNAEDQLRQDQGITIIKSKDNPRKVVAISDERGRVIQPNTDEWKDQNEISGHMLDRAVASIEEGSAGDSRFMVQPAFQAVGVTEEDRALGATWETSTEGRVHVVTRNGKASVVPYATLAGRADAFPVVFANDDIRAMEKAVQDAIDALPESERSGQTYAPDVMKTKDGWRVVELNASVETGQSLWLEQNPFIIDAYVSYVTGREPAHVRFIKELLLDKAVTSRTTTKPVVPTPQEAPAQPTGKTTGNIGTGQQPATSQPPSA